MDQARSVTANFLPDTYTVTGTVNPDGGGEVSCPAEPVTHGDTVECRVTTNAGYTLTGIAGCGGTPGTASPYTTGAITEACTVTASFAVTVDGACGSANGVAVATAPTAANLCSAGTASDLSGTGPWNWTCDSESGGAAAQCTAPVKKDATVTPVPTLGEWSLMLLGLLAAGLGARRLRRA